MKMMNTTCDLREMFPVLCWIRNELGEVVQSPSLLAALHDAQPGYYALCSFDRTLQGAPLDYGVVLSTTPESVRELIEGQCFSSYFECCSRKCESLAEIVDIFYDRRGSELFWMVYPISEKLFNETIVEGSFPYKIANGILEKDYTHPCGEYRDNLLQSPVDPKRYPVQVWVVNEFGLVRMAKDIASSIRESHRGYYALCDYRVYYPFEEKSSFGKVWRVGTDVRSLIEACIGEECLNDKTLIEQFLKESVFSCFRILPATEELFNACIAGQVDQPLSSIRTHYGPLVPYVRRGGFATLTPIHANYSIERVLENGIQSSSPCMSLVSRDDNDRPGFGVFITLDPELTSKIEAVCDKYNGLQK